MTELRALSVRQPYAWAICANLKTIENRTWTTRHRGLVAIHASASPQYVNDLIRELEPGELDRDYFQYGAIIGFAEIEEVSSYGPSHEQDPFASGPYCWKMTAGRFLKHPVSLKGKLNLFKLPSDLQSELLSAETWTVDTDNDATASLLHYEMRGEPDVIENYLSLTDEFFATGNHEEAATIAADRLIELEPDNPDALLAKALFECEENPEAAMAKVERVIEMVPDSVSAWLLAGDIHYRESRWDDAMAAFDRAITYDPVNLAALYWRSNARLESGDYAAALADATELLSADPDNIDSQQLVQTIEDARNTK